MTTDPAAGRPSPIASDLVAGIGSGRTLSAHCIALEAWRRGLTVTLSGSAGRQVRVDDGERRIDFDESRPSTFTRSADLAPLTPASAARRRLREHDVPTLAPEADADDAPGDASGDPIPVGERIRALVVDTDVIACLRLDGAAEKSPEGTAIAVPDDVRSAAVEAVQAFDNIRVAGVDLVRPESHGAGLLVLGLSTRPLIGPHMSPARGDAVDVPRILLDRFFPTSRRSSESAVSASTFDRASVVALLESRTVDEITLAPPPTGGLPARRSLRIITGPAFVNLPTAKRTVLHRSAARHGIAGDITQPKREIVEANLGAGTEEALDAFCGEFVDLLDGRIESAQPWENGLLTTGLRIARPLLGRKR